MGPSEYEPVHTVDEYYDGPRIGTADYGGRVHAYRSLYLDSATWDADEDRFELTLLSDGQPTGQPFLVRGAFRVRQLAPDLPPGVLRPLEVSWTPLSSSTGAA